MDIFNIQIFINTFDFPISRHFSYRDNISYIPIKLNFQIHNKISSLKITLNLVSLAFFYVQLNPKIDTPAYQFKGFLYLSLKSDIN